MKRTFVVLAVLILTVAGFATDTGKQKTPETKPEVTASTKTPEAPQPLTLTETEQLRLQNLQQQKTILQQQSQLLQNQQQELQGQYNTLVKTATEEFNKVLKDHKNTAYVFDAQTFSFTPVPAPQTASK